ncbi:hypothetical protein HanPI659440_Chr13g0484221 [Helianthus annuus]|nr:hypothetical protein HanPI659440_Chr13g0484221 [Helianthus annuus]
MGLSFCGCLAYMVKINLKNVLKSTHAKVHTTPTLKTEVVEHKSPTITTPSNCGMHSSEAKTVHTTPSLKTEVVEYKGPNITTPSYCGLHSSEGRTIHTTPSLKTEVVECKSPTITTPSDSGMHSSKGRTQDGSDMKYHNLLDDIEKFKGRFKSANKLSKPNPGPSASTTFMKPTASHLAKKINAVDIHGNSCGRSPKVQTPTGSETEDPKRQKLEIGFLRKVSQLKHETSFSHKTTTKATIAQTPKLLTEERARRRRYSSLHHYLAIRKAWLTHAFFRSFTSSMRINYTHIQVDLLMYTGSEHKQFCFIGSLTL